VGNSEAKLIVVEAENSKDQVIAAKKNEVSEMRAEQTSIQGKGESQVAQVMASRRKYEYLNSKLDVIKSIRDNKNVKIFGDNSDDVISQMAAFRVSNGQAGI